MSSKEEEMQGYIKAGLVGGVLGIVLAITTWYGNVSIGDIFFIVLAGLASMLLYLAVGIWAVSWSSPPLSSLKEAASSGALAGLLSALFVGIIIVPIALISDSVPPIMDSLFSLRDAERVFVLILAQIQTAFRWMVLSTISAFVYVAVKKK